jgi:flagellar protein FliO/FliZ
MVRLLFCLLVLAQPLWAAEASAPPSMLASALKMLAVLAVLIGLLLLFYAASRKGFGVLPKRRQGLIQVLETRPLGGRKFLCVVRVRGEELLLGLSNDRIECLSKLAPAEDFTERLEQAEEDS